MTMDFFESELKNKLASRETLSKRSVVASSNLDLRQPDDNAMHIATLDREISELRANLARLDSKTGEART